MVNLVLTASYLVIDDLPALSVLSVSSVLQAAQSVLIALFQLNTPEFSMLLAALPKTFQDGATKLLQNHLKNTGNVAQARLARPSCPPPRPPVSLHHRNLLFFSHWSSSGSDGQPSHPPHPPISSQLVQPGHLSHQHLPEHPLTKVTHTTHKAPPCRAF